VTYVRHAPRPPLDEYLQGVWYFEGGQTAHTRERVLPHGAMQLVIDLDDDRLEVFDPRDLAHPRRFGGPLLCGPTPTTRFRIGSVSKQFTAMAILMLEKRNRLNVSDPVCAHLAACPQAWGQVIPTTKATLLIVFRQPVTPAAQVAQAGERPLVTQPGTEWRYCNVCYAALGLVVEKESGTTLTQFLKTQIFDQLGMRDTGIDQGQSIPYEALGYTRRGTIRTPRPLGPLVGLRCRPDLLDCPRPLSLGRCALPRPLAWRRTVSSTDAQCCFNRKHRCAICKWLGLRQYSGPCAHWHNGAIPGFISQIHRFPDDHAVVIVLTNLDGLHEIPAVTSRLDDGVLSSG